MLLALTVVFNALGNVLLSEGMKRTGNLSAWRPGEVLRFFLRALANGTIWLMVICPAVVPRQNATHNM